MRDGRRQSPKDKKRSVTRSRMSRYLEGVKDVAPNDYELVSKFVTEHGKIMPARSTGANAKQQRQIKRAVRRARVMGILP